MSEYRVRFESAPGMWTLYNGIKTVAACDKEDAKEQAYRMVRKSFVDRPRSAWIFTVIK